MIICRIPLRVRSVAMVGLSAVCSHPEVAGTVQCFWQLLFVAVRSYHGNGKRVSTVGEPGSWLASCLIG